MIIVVKGVAIIKGVLIFVQVQHILRNLFLTFNIIYFFTLLIQFQCKNLLNVRKY